MVKSYTITTKQPFTGENRKIRKLEKLSQISGKRHAILNIKDILELGVEVQAFNSSTPEAEAGG